MGLFDKLFGKEKNAAPAPVFEPVPGELYAPVTGKYIPQEELPDPGLALGFLGSGCGFIPEEETVIAPCSGTVYFMEGIDNQILITGDDGLEIQLQIGADPFSASGDSAAFHRLVKEGQHVRCGQPLMTFSLEETGGLSSEGLISSFLIVNEECLSSLEFDTGKHFQSGECIGRAVRNPAREAAPVHSGEPVPGELYAPVTGNYIPQEEIADELIASGILGPGCGIHPDEETVSAPCSGTVSLTDRINTIQITSDDGLKIQLQIGLDPYFIPGGSDGFHRLAEDGQHVRCGQPLMTFSLNGDRRIDSTCVVLILNGDDLCSLDLETDKFIQSGARFCRYQF